MKTIGGSFEYDGEAHGATVTVSTLPKGYSLETAASSASATDVDDGIVAATADTLVIRNTAGKDVTKLLNVKKTDGSITITPATLTVKTESDSKVYDGTALTAAGTIDGFKNGETATFTVTGSQTEVGSSKNTYTLDFDGTAKQNNYRISESIGSLAVAESEEEIIVTTRGGSFGYDGKAHGATVTVSKLPAGYTLESAASGATATDVTTVDVPATADTLVIRNAQGEDVTANLKITYVDDTIRVIPAELTVITDGAEKTYDGEALTADGWMTGLKNGETATFTVTGSQTAVGDSRNTYSLVFDGTAKEGNYIVKETIGDLKVSEYTGEIVATTTGGSFEYDGEAHGATVTVSELPKGYTLETAASGASVTNVADGIVTATADTLVIRNAAGEDVTGRLNIRKVNSTVAVTPATLTVTTESAGKIYDGEALTAAGKIEGYKNNETATFAVTGSQTGVGDSKNTYSLAFDGTARESNYTIKEAIGDLKVTEYAGEIVVTTTGGTFEYDGQAHGATVAVSTLPKGYSLEAAASGATATDVTAEAVPATADTLVIRNAAGEDVTGRLNIRYADGTIAVTPATLTIATESADKVYDGEALTAGGRMTGLKNGETATFAVTGTLTDVDETENTYSLVFDGTAKAGNYVIDATTGTLKVTEYAGEIVVTTTGGSFEYDGQAHGATVSVSELPKGYSLERAESWATVTNVADGTMNATADIVEILNAKGEYVTDRLNIRYADGSIAVTPAPLTIKTESANKVYDGTALTAAGTIEGFRNNETASFTVTGSRTAVGTSNNSYSLVFDGTAKAGNYAISESIGKLTVTESAETIVVTARGGTFEYDGQPHGATVTVSELPAGYSLEAAASGATATDVTRTAVKATADTLVIRNAQGEDVTANLRIRYVDDTITVTPATLTVTTDSAAKTYDGNALTAAGKVDGYKNGETATFTVTGSQTAVGNSKNAYSLVFDGTAKQSNYTIRESIGDLKVNEYTGEITVTTTGGSFEYDGRAHGATVKVSELPAGYRLEAAASNATATNVDDGTVKAAADTLVIRNAEGEDVTGRLNINRIDGSITITPAKLVLQTMDDSMTYNGETLTGRGGIGPFRNNETVTFRATGQQTAVGESKNTYELEWNGTAKESNYTIEEHIGTLKVTENAEEILVVANGGVFTYDGQPHHGTVYVSDLPKGYTLETAASTTTVTDVTDGIEITADQLVIRNAAGEDVTGRLNLRKLDGMIVIEPAKLNIVTESAEKVYDGEALKADGSIGGFRNDETATFNVTGEQTAVGDSENTETLVFDGTAKEENYRITKDIGTLVVTENEEEIVATAIGGSYEYDGKAHGATVSVSKLPAGYTLESAASNATATDVTTEPVKASVDTLVIRNAAGEDVTDRLNIRKVDGSITITPATLTVVTEGARKTYDGEALKAAGRVTGYRNNETATLTVTGSQTGVGESRNTYSLVFDGTAKESNYIIKEAIGTLKVTEYAGEIIATAIGGTYEYDGLDHGATVKVSKLPKGYRLDTAASEATAVYVDQGAVEATVDTLVIRNAAGEDVTGRLNIRKVAGSITITPAPLTITTESAARIYNGKELTAGGKIEGLKNGETVTFEANGMLAGVGETPNTYYLEWNGTAGAGNYTIRENIGTLKASEYTGEIVVTTTGGTYEYDGEAHGATVTVTGLPAGYRIESAASGASATDVTTEAVPATADTLRIDYVTGGEATENLNIRYVDGSITVTPATLTVATDSADKAYDGEALTAEGSITGLKNDETVIFGVTGSQTDAGESANSYSLVFDGTAKESNYVISENIGTLNVAPLTTVVVTITGHSDRLTYDAKAHTVSGYDVAISNPLYTGNDFIFTGSAKAAGTDVGTYRMNLKPEDFTNTNPNFDNVTFAVADGSLVIDPRTVTITADNKTVTYGEKDPLLTATTTGLAGTDYIVTSLSREPGRNIGTYAISVTAVPNPNYEIKTEAGTLTINPKTVTVTAKDEAKIYGEEEPGLTVKVEGLAYEDSIDLIHYTVERMTGEDAGEYAITPVGETEQGNYTVKYVTGKMTVYPLDTVVVRITANEGVFEYDGQEKDLSGYTVQISDPRYTEYDFTFSGSSELKATNAGIYRTNMTAEDFANSNGNFENVAFIVNNGELEIQKRKISITSADAEKAYDGTPLRAEEATFDGSFAEGEGVELTYTGRITLEGSAANSFTYTMAEGTNADNYDITTHFGTLTVTRNAATRTQRLTITYVNEDGETLKTFARDYQVGTNYSVATEKISGYTADLDKVTGTMGEEDVNVTVTYSKVTYNLTVQFVDVNNGREEAQAVTLSMKEGDSYAIFVPRVEGYVSKISEVTGTMPGSNRTITVFMIPEGDADSGRYHAAIDIDDYGTPLGVENSILGGGEIIE